MRYISIRAISSVSLGCVVLLSFLVQYFNNILQSISVFLAFLILFSFVFVLSRIKAGYVKKNTFNWVWIIALLVLLISYVPARRYISVYADLIVFLCGLSVVFFSGNKKSIYGLSIRIIKIMSVYYAFSIYIQLFFPSFYDIYLGLLTLKDRLAVINFEISHGMYTGFSTNCGFTAAHLSAGILCYISTIRCTKNHKIDSWKLFILFVALLMTGKRSTSVFVVFAILSLYIYSAKGSDKIKIYTYALIFVLSIFVLYYTFSSFFLMFPSVSRIIQSVNEVLIGLDVTSNRTIYYDYALKLFYDNPWFGIGWGNYRNMTLGHVTWVNTVEVHNIYLQMLTEMGVVGFVGMIIPMITIWMKTKSFYKESIHTNITKDRTWMILISYSFSYQTFFLLQGFTENPLYDINFLLMYLICCSIPAVYSRYIKTRKISKNYCLIENKE